jgi:hypothetical protein
MTMIYTHERHAALVLVGRERVAAIDSLMRDSDGTELATGLFTALVVLENAGYIERRMPEDDAFRRWPVQLTVAGNQLLRWFDQLHARPMLDRQPVAALRSSTR